MSLKKRIEEDLKRALKAPDPAALAAIRLLRSALLNREIELGGEADDGEIIRLIDKQINQRRESARIYREAGRTDLAEAEEREQAYLETLLPARLSEAELDALVAEVIQETGAQSLRDMGSVMKAAQARAAGRIDARTLSARVKQRLSQR